MERLLGHTVCMAVYQPPITILKLLAMHKLNEKHAHSKTNKYSLNENGKTSWTYSMHGCIPTTNNSPQIVSYAQVRREERVLQL